ncbi:MAG: hypothetical protein E7560_02970 [Ruminococcaceae bacterium]|nr:hypothetical protein [Oscillospiraceae bacterium]
MTNDENVVVCWCCEYFFPEFGDPINKGKMTGSMCSKREASRLPSDNVCEEFLLRSGLHTRKSIPSYCKHYKYNFIEKILKNKSPNSSS